MDLVRVGWARGEEMGESGFGFLGSGGVGFGWVVRDAGGSRARGLEQGASRLPEGRDDETMAGLGGAQFVVWVGWVGRQPGMHISVPTGEIGGGRVACLAVWWFT